MIKEFKEFVMRGNMLDLAVGLIMATYFGAIIKSLVNDVLMPPIGVAMGGVDFKDIKTVIGEKTLDDGTIEMVTINWGLFINTIITFVIVGFCVFLVVKAYNSVKKKEEPAPEAPSGPSEVDLLTEIRDSLKK